MQTEVADLLIPFCDAGSLNRKEIALNVRKRILVSISFVEVEPLNKRIFGGHAHLEWCDVKQYLQEVSHSTAEWMQLMQLLDFVEEPPLRECVVDLMQGNGANGTASNKSSAKVLTPLESMRVCLYKARVNGSW